YHGPGVSATISPDGSRVASVAYRRFFDADKEKEKSERVVVVWDSATGERVGEWQVPHAPATEPRFSSDGKSLAVSYGRDKGKSGIAIFDAATGKLQKDLDGHASRPNLIGFTPDSKSILFREGHWEPLVLWDIKNAKELRQWKYLEGPSDWIKER